jgi:ElaB/YqjD/DUF883 family membrane-anchored ribosome-binding protein
LSVSGRRSGDGTFTAAGLLSGQSGILQFMESIMASASSASSHIRDTVKEGAREFGKAASAASGTIESDLQALRDDVARLAEQLADILANKGDAVWRHAKASVDDAISNAEDKGREAVDAMREVTDNLVGVVDESLKERPYVTLAIAAGLGFVLGMTWRR